MSMPEPVDFDVIQTVFKDGSMHEKDEAALRFYGKTGFKPAIKIALVAYPNEKK